MLVVQGDDDVMCEMRADSAFEVGHTEEILPPQCLDPVKDLLRREVEFRRFQRFFQCLLYLQQRNCIVERNFDMLCCICNSPCRGRLVL